MAWQMTRADGIDWHLGTQALPLAASISTANFRDQGDGAGACLQQQRQSDGEGQVVQLTNLFSFCISAPFLWLVHNWEPKTKSQGEHESKFL